MLQKAKNSSPLLFLAFLFLPFLLLTNFYPFMRFGMFAEPIRTDTPIYYTIRINSTELHSEKAFNVSDDIFQQWAHTHFCKNDSATLINKLKTIQCISGDIVILKTTK